MRRDLRFLASLLWLMAGCGLAPSVPSTSPDAVIGTDLVVAPDNFVPSDAPDIPGFSVTAVDPPSGPAIGGTRVIVSGTGFVAGSSVVFGASEGREVVVQNATTLAATTPPQEPGFVDVRVVRPDGKVASLGDAFFYEIGRTVDRVDPESGPAAGGTPIQVRGSGFLPDSVLVIGGRVAIDAHVIDSGTIVALTPPGEVGPRDVLVVNKAGTAGKRRGFSYAPLPETTACSPASFEAGKPVKIAISGTGLAGADFIVASNGVASEIVFTDGLPEVVLTGTVPGPVGFTIRTPGGLTRIQTCAWALSPADMTPPTPRVIGVAPDAGSSAGGYDRVVITTGIGDVSRVRFGGFDAAIKEISDDGREIRVSVPGHEPGVVDVSVSGGVGEAVAVGAFHYQPSVSLSGVSPQSGPPSGGTLVTLTGERLDAVAEVRVGPLAAAIVSGPSFGSLLVRTAPANPGIADVTVVTDWGETIVLPDAFTFGAKEPAFTVVTPSAGAIAGGTLVAVVGSGLSGSTRVTFGGVHAKIADASDPARLRVFTPPGTVGPVDVTVEWADGTTRTLPRAFTYFDPTGYFGGTWGETVDGSVNVTVLDQYTEKPLPLAVVILGSDASTPYLGLTNLSGQITFSGDDLFGPQQVTASREDCSTYTMSGADAENITLFLQTTLPSSGGGGGSPPKVLPPGLISGRVSGTSKYLLAPPGSCADRPLVHGTLCGPCATDADCGPGGRCLSPSFGPTACASPCVAEGDCPQGYDCYGIGEEGTACLPSPGRPEIRCGTSDQGLFDVDTDFGPGAIASPDGTFVVNSRLGDVALWCLGGFRRFEDGVFEPVLLGLRRHVAVYPAQITTDRDVSLDIRLERQLEVRLLRPPGGPNGPNRHSLMLAVDLGSDGVLHLWPLLQGIDQDRFVVDRLPTVFGDAFADSMVILYGQARSQTSDTIPYSASWEYDWRPGENLRVGRITKAVIEVLDPLIRPEASGGCPLPSGEGLVFGPGGATYGLEPDGRLTVLGSAFGRTLRDCGPLPDGRVLAVGDDGTVAVRDDALWTREYPPTAADLRGMAVGPDGTAWVVGDGVILRRAPEGTWARLDPGTKTGLNAVVAAADGTVVVFGNGGLVLRVKGDRVEPDFPWPASRDLRDAVSIGSEIVAVGRGGLVLTGSPDGPFMPVSSGTEEDLDRITVANDGVLVAGGSLGTVIRREAGSWSRVVSPGLKCEIAALIPLPDATVYAFCSDTATIGPFVRIPVFSSPAAGTPWADRTLAWSRDGPPVPSLTYTRLYGPKASSDWTVVAVGTLDRIVLPDLFAAAKLKPLDGTDLKLHAMHILIDGFDFNRFDDTAFYMSHWRSWAVQQFGFKGNP